MVHGHGGRRPGAGRPAGRRNKATQHQKATLSELAREHAQVAIDALADVARSGESESARVSAACALLDRGFGKPRQMAEQAETDPGRDAIAELVQSIQKGGGSRAPIVTDVPPDTTEPPER